MGFEEALAQDVLIVRQPTLNPRRQRSTMSQKNWAPTVRNQQVHAHRPAARDMSASALETTLTSPERRQTGAYLTERQKPRFDYAEERRLIWETRREADLKQD